MYVGWEEVYVCTEKGRREIHYLLKRIDGGSDLAVVAKEKTLRHFTYRFLLDFSSFDKPKSKQEVIHWLNSFIPESPVPALQQMNGCSTYGNEKDEPDVETMKTAQLRKLGNHTKEFLWLGSQWTCKKRRKHYQAFSRNGTKISVNQFVHVLAEENKRLVAYLDDMYEDTKGRKLVVVRWFHKVDEVGIDLPHNYNEREIFFSLCLQDLSVECIDGLATVLSPSHYAKFVSEAANTLLQPYVCCQQYDNDGATALDITQVRGYWKQDVVKYMFSIPSARTTEKACLRDASRKKEVVDCFFENKPRKRLRLSRERKVNVPCATVRPALDDVDVIRQTKPHLVSGPDSICKKDNIESLAQHMNVGSMVEVLSQDSGLRGCWFRATIIKKHKSKVKLLYCDIKDAENEDKNLEEWVLASRIAVQDEMGVRLNGRTTIRPSGAHNAKVSAVISVGTIVDAWWLDGWWEGIVIEKESCGKLQVYFPGEKLVAGFTHADLRRSHEWVGGTWKELSERQDIVVSILSDLVKEGRSGKHGSDKCLKDHVSSEQHLECDEGKDFLFDTRVLSSNLSVIPESRKSHSTGAVIDLLNDNVLTQLKWESTCKRRRRCVVRKLQQHRSYGINFEREDSPENHQEYLISSTAKIGKENRMSVKVDHDKCKYASDSLFSPPVVPRSLVMSR